MARMRIVRKRLVAAGTLPSSLFDLRGIWWPAAKKPPTSIRSEVLDDRLCQDEAARRLSLRVPTATSQSRPRRLRACRESRPTSTPRARCRPRSSTWPVGPHQRGLRGHGGHPLRQVPAGDHLAELKPSESPLENLNLAGLPVQILDKIMSPTMVGIEKRAGQKTYHITGQVAKADIEDIAGSVSNG